MIMLEEIDFNSDYAYDRILELANCVDEKQTLLGKSTFAYPSIQKI